MKTMRWYWFAIAGIALAIWLGPPTASLVNESISDTADSVQSSIDSVRSAKDRAQLTLALAEFEQANDPWNGVREAFAQFFTAAGLIAAAVTGFRQLRISRSTEITDRYSRSIDQLGSKSIHQRIGGIYALEQIQADSPQYVQVVREVLAAFVRRACPLGSEKGSMPEHNLDLRRPDAQAALRVLGRLNSAEVVIGEPALYRADLRKASFRDANLDGVNLSGSWLNGASFRGAQLRSADFTNADISEADLSHAILDGAEGLHTVTGLDTVTEDETHWPDGLRKGGDV